MSKWRVKTIENFHYNSWKISWKILFKILLKITFKDYRFEMDIHPSCIEQEITPCEINEYFEDLVLITKVTEKMKQEISHFLCMLNRPMKISLFNIDSQVQNF